MKHLRKFEEYDLGHRFSTEEEIQPLELDDSFDDERVDIYSDNSNDYGDDEDNVDCKPCSDDEDEEDEEPRTWGDENLYVEKIVSFKQFEAKKDSKGKTPKTEKEKELAAKYPPKDKITRGDFIAAAIENKKTGKKENKSKEEENSDKGLTTAQKKLPEALKKAIEAKNKKK